MLLARDRKRFQNNMPNVITAVVPKVLPKVTPKVTPKVIPKVTQRVPPKTTPNVGPVSRGPRLLFLIRLLKGQRHFLVDAASGPASRIPASLAHVAFCY